MCACVCAYSCLYAPLRFRAANLSVLISQCVNRVHDSAAVPSLRVADPLWDRNINLRGHEMPHRIHFFFSDTPQIFTLFSLSTEQFSFRQTSHHKVHLAAALEPSIALHNLSQNNELEEFWCITTYWTTGKVCPPSRRLDPTPEDPNQFENGK